MLLKSTLCHQVLVKLFSSLASGAGLVPLQYQVLLLPRPLCSSMQHPARGLQPGQNLRHHQSRPLHAHNPFFTAACQSQQTQHGVAGHHASDAAVPQDTCAVRQAAAQPAAGPYRRWRCSTTSRSPQADPAAPAAAGTSRARYTGSLRDAQQGVQQLQQQQYMISAGAGSAVAAASRNRSTSSSIAPVKQRRVSSSLAAAVAAAAAAANASTADALATQAAAGVSKPSPRGIGVVAAAAVTNSSAGRSRSTSSSIQPMRQRRVSSSLVASIAAATAADALAGQGSSTKGRSSSSSRAASSAAVDAFTEAASVKPSSRQLMAGMQAQVQAQQQQQHHQRQQGPRGPRRSSTSSLWPVQQQRIQQQQQLQQQQFIPVAQHNEIQRLQQLCRNPDLHWCVHGQHHQQSEHEGHHPDEQQPHITWELQQQQLMQQWPAELVQPPNVEDSVLLDISALWRENQREMLAGQQQQQRRHLLLEHQQVMWVAVHQPDGPGSPAAVWVQGAQLELTAEQLQLSGFAEQQQALVRLQRPDMGQRPAAVLEGLTFEHSSSWGAHALQESRPAAAEAGEAASADVAGEAGAAPVWPAAAAADAAGQGVVAAGHGSCEVAAAAAAAPGAEVGMVPGASSSESSSSSSSSWYDYLLLCSGEFSVVEYHNMFPNSLAHCGEGRALHNARGAADVASFVAEPQEPALRQHMINLIRQAWDRRNYEEGTAITSSSSSGSWTGGSNSRGRGSRGLDPRWVMAKILQRWGAGAMVKFGVDDAYFSARFLESGVVTLPAPTVGVYDAVPDVSVYSSADVQHRQ